MATIKEHYEAGHYGTDEKGRTVIPCTNGGTFTIATIDAPPPCHILGWETRRDGTTRIEAYGWGGFIFLPPPPRKVKVTAAMAVSASGGHKKIGFCAHELRRELPGYHIVELTGEYEEPWS